MIIPVRSAAWFDKLFRDKQGRLVLLQWPNLSLTLWGLSTLAAHLFYGTAAQRASLVALTAILFWSVDEIARGSTPFRRILGGTVLLVSLLGRL